MKPWPIFTLLLLLPQTALHGQGVADQVKKGDAALADGLWEVAELHFRDSLKNPELANESKPAVAIRLAESLVRAGNPSGALEVLAQSLLAKHPETPFWKAQALAGQHHFNEAAALFSSLLENPESPYRIESASTLASLQLALGQPEKALQTLARLTEEAEPATAARAALGRVEILLDLDRPADARAEMPAKEAIDPRDVPLAAFLNAQLLLRERKPAEAEVIFQDLLTRPQGQSLTHHHRAAIGLADAIDAGGNREAALKSLLSFIQEHPESPELDILFKRVLGWLPEKPTATDPVLERIATWITPEPPPAIGPIATESSSAVASWPADPTADERPERLAHSLFTRAIGLQRIGTPEAAAETARLLTRLRIGYPGHPLADRALYQQARWLLDSGSVTRAFSILDTLRETTGDPSIRGEAAFLEARISYQNGESEKSIRLFDEAAAALDGRQARTARQQAAIIRLRSGVRTIQQQAGPQDSELASDLELERALAATPPAEAAAALGKFLAAHPDHPRADEARMAAAEAALSGPLPDPAAAAPLLDALADSNIPPQRLALARLRAADLSGDTAATIAAAQAVIDTYPTDPAAAEAALTLGRNLFQTGNYNPARLVLEKLASTDTNPARAQAAWLLAARSAALGGTPQSKEQARILFDNAIAAKGPVTSIARLEKARHLIDIYQLPEASAFLEKWITTLPDDDPLRLPAGLLLGEALYAQGTGDSASLVRALAVYDRLLVQAKTHPALLNRLQYLRGTVLEQLPDPKDPAKKREGQAFQAYHSVLETTTPPAEWEYFERCGFRALALLEKAKRWQAAITVARKIASFNGPRSAEATQRAKELQLEHMIWTD
jgi:TolA-binding protein